MEQQPAVHAWRAGSQDSPAAAAAAAHNGRGSSAPVTPSASCMSDESDLSNGQQWWLPQPKPSLDEQHAEWRPALPLLQALQCSVCSELLKEAITAAECGHSYCYDCIDKHITIGGRSNLCPVCNVLLGPNPFEHNKLMYDFTLDSLVRKVFPRPLLDAALEARRLEREEATRQAKAFINSRPGRLGQIRPSASIQGLTGSGRLGGSTAGLAALGSPDVELALFPLPQEQSQSSSASKPAAEALPALPKPYIRAPGAMTIAALRSWLGDRLAGKKADSVRLPCLHLVCAGKAVDHNEQPTMTLQELHETVWKPQVKAGSSSTAAIGAAAAAATTTGGARVEDDAGQQRRQQQEALGDRIMLVYYAA